MFDAKGSNAESDEFVAQAAAKSKLAGNSRQNDVEIGKFLLELYQKALHMPEKELYDYFLDHAVGLTQSTIGFFHFVSDDQKSIILTTWNKEALRNCTASYTTHYSIDQAGNWADCVRLSRPIIYNDFPESPNQKGLPEGHAAIRRMMSIPILENGKVQIIFGVGNKTEPYDEDDVVQLELVAYELNKILKQRRSENALRETEKDLNRAQAVAKTGSWRLDTQTNVLQWSDETYRIFGMPEGTLLTYETFLGAVHPDDRGYVDRKWQAALGGEPYDIEPRIIVDGKIKWVREKAELDFDKGHVLQDGFGTVQDITERKQMQNKLEDYAKNLEQLVEERTKQLKDSERLAAIGQDCGDGWA